MHPLKETWPTIWRRFVVAFLDLAGLTGAYLLAFLLRFEFDISQIDLALVLETYPTFIVSFYLSAYVSSLYRGLYAYSTFTDLTNILKTLALSSLLTAATILFIRQGLYPRSILILAPMLNLLSVCGVRFAIRLAKGWLRARSVAVGDEKAVLLVGAGELGDSLLRQIQKTPELNYHVVGIIDDDPSKWGMRMHGVPILGGRTSLAGALAKQDVDEVIITIARRRGEIVAAVVAALRELDPRPELKIAPGLDEMLQSQSQIAALRKVRPADLLNRDVIHLDEPQIARTLERKAILITGAGGTIGGELSRQVLKYHPEKVILLDSHANSLFFVEASIRDVARGTAVTAVLGDVRDRALIERLFQEHRPAVVLHAAAHKHLLQLEFNIQEGVTNNVLGTHYVAQAADRFGAEALLLVSTDKAVKPTSVMGATKRAAEHVVGSWARNSKTRFSAVRFGNVLGSSGSVLPIFQEQIAKGGPVTVTDANVTRYFMTVEEAVGLILQAVSMSKGGETFVLKMGTPVKIIDMARNLITLSGLEPDKDIQIKITELKQGEKMDEELWEDPAELGQSAHPDISVLQLRAADTFELDPRMLELEVAIRGTDQAAVLRKLRDLVPTFEPARLLLDPAA